MPKTITPNLIGSAEVCERLGIDRSTLSRWVQVGRIGIAMRLPKPTGVLLFDPAEVERVAAERRAS